MAAVLSLLIIAAMPGATAADEPDTLAEWAFSRDIVLSGEERYKAFFLDEEVYRSTRPDLADLRVVDGKGETVAYYTQAGHSLKEETRWTYATELISTANENGNTRLDFRVIPVKDTADTPATQLVIETQDTGFAKNIAVYGSFDGIDWLHTADGSIYRVDNAVKLDLPLREPQKFKYYRLVIPNNLERIAVGKLQVVYDRRDEDRKHYSRTARAEYKIKTEGKHTRLELDNREHMKITGIRLEVTENFRRAYTVHERTAEGSERAVTFGELYSLSFKDVAMADRTIRFSAPVREEAVVVRIDNKDDRPLNIKNVEVEYSIDKVVFEDTGRGPYKLLYGNAEALKPSYDMEQFKMLVENEAQAVCSLGSPVKKQNVTGKTTKRLPLGNILNIAISISAVLLLLIIARKLLAKK